MTVSPGQRRRPIARLRRAAWVVVLAWARLASATASDDLKAARNNYEYGDFAKTVQILAALPDIAVLPLESERIEAWRLLGLAEFFLGHRAQAENAFFGLLKQNPDYALDPFYVPPDAVAFFDEVKKSNEEYLAPIRERRRARIREQQAEEAARKDAERRRTETQKTVVPPTIIVETRVRENSRLTASMPFGVGQFQNANEGAGTLLAVSQGLMALTSVVAYGLIDQLRDDTLGGRYSQRDFDVAQTLSTVKYVSGTLFYLLWAFAAAEAHVNFVPVVTLGSGAPPVLSPLPAGTPAPGVASPPPVARPAPAALPTALPAAPALPEPVREAPPPLAPPVPVQPLPTPPRADESAAPGPTAQALPQNE